MSKPKTGPLVCADCGNENPVTPDSVVALLLLVPKLGVVPFTWVGCPNEVEEFAAGGAPKLLFEPKLVVVPLACAGCPKSVEVEFCGA